jgi:hypothetical protein
MTRLVKLVIQLSLLAVLLFSFGAAAYEPGVNDDGDENLGIAVVLQQARKAPAGQESARRNRIVTTAITAATQPNQHQGSSNYVAPAPLQALGSPNVPIALRT